MKADRVRTLPISRLDLSKTCRNDVVEFIFNQKDLDWDPGIGRGSLKELARLADGCTVQDFINTCRISSTRPAKRGYLCSDNGGARISFHLVARKLTQLGMTYLDWDMLPYSTVTPAMLKRLKKEDLLKQSVRILNTLSSSAIRDITTELGLWSAYKDVTIGDLLTVNSDSKNVTRSLSKTRQRLRELGFSYKDGPFLQFGTRRRLIESLMQEDGISRKVAKLISGIAEKRGWVGPFLSES